MTMGIKKESTVSPLFSLHVSKNLTVAAAAVLTCQQNSSCHWLGPKTLTASQIFYLPNKTSELCNLFHCRLSAQQLYHHLHLHKYAIYWYLVYTFANFFYRIKCGLRFSAARVNCDKTGGDVPRLPVNRN